MVYPGSILLSLVTHSDQSQGKHFAWPALLLWAPLYLSLSAQQERCIQSYFPSPVARRKLWQLAFLQTTDTFKPIRSRIISTTDLGTISSSVCSERLIYHQSCDSSMVCLGLVQIMLLNKTSKYHTLVFATELIFINGLFSMGTRAMLSSG